MKLNGGALRWMIVSSIRRCDCRWMGTIKSAMQSTSGMKLRSLTYDANCGIRTKFFPITSYFVFLISYFVFRISYFVFRISYFVFRVSNITNNNSSLDSTFFPLWSIYFIFLLFCKKLHLYIFIHEIYSSINHLRSIY